MGRSLQEFAVGPDHTCWPDPTTRVFPTLARASEGPWRSATAWTCGEADLHPPWFRL